MHDHFIFKTLSVLYYDKCNRCVLRKIHFYLTALFWGELCWLLLNYLIPLREEAKVITWLLPPKSSLQLLSLNPYGIISWEQVQKSCRVRAPRNACVHTEDVKAGFMCVGRDALGCELSLAVPQKDGLPLWAGNGKALGTRLATAECHNCSPPSILLLMWVWEWSKQTEHRLDSMQKGFPRAQVPAEAQPEVEYLPEAAGTIPRDPSQCHLSCGSSSHAAHEAWCQHLKHYFFTKHTILVFFVLILTWEFFYHCFFRENGREGGKRRESKREWVKHRRERDTATASRTRLNKGGRKRTRNPGTCPWPGIKPSGPML